VPDKLFQNLPKFVEKYFGTAKVKDNLKYQGTAIDCKTRVRLQLLRALRIGQSFSIRYKLILSTIGKVTQTIYDRVKRQILVYV